MRRYTAMTAGMAVLGTLILANCGWAQVHQRSQILSGTYLDPAMQRADILPHVFRFKFDEYRQVYNRPRYLTGKMAHKFEPSSQEAMAWETNHAMGNYRKHAGAYVPMYWYPKPWEILNTRARPDNSTMAELVIPSESSGPVMEAVTPDLR